MDLKKLKSTKKRQSEPSQQAQNDQYWIKGTPHTRLFKRPKRPGTPCSNNSRHGSWRKILRTDHILKEGATESQVSDVVTKLAIVRSKVDSLEIDGNLISS